MQNCGLTIFLTILRRVRAVALCGLLHREMQHTEAPEGGLMGFDFEAD